MTRQGREQITVPNSIHLGVREKRREGWINAGTLEQIILYIATVVTSSM